jgi:hypothetical protein
LLLLALLLCEHLFFLIEVLVLVAIELPVHFLC